MTLKSFEIEFYELSKDIFLRADFDYFEIKKKLNLANSKKLKSYLLYLETGKPIKPEDYEEISNNAHIVVRNIIDGHLNTKKLIYISDLKANNLKKYRIEKGDIIIAISSNCGESFFYDGDCSLNLTLSHYLARFKVNENFINPKFLNYYINSKIIKQYFRSIETGKTLKNLSKHYIKELPLLIPNKPFQDKTVAQIEPIEQKIKQLKSQIKDPKEIINKVFAREFGFDLEKLEKIKKRKFFEVEFKEISDYHSLRCDIKNQKYFNIFKKIISNFSSSFSLKEISKDAGKYGANEPAKDGEKGVDIRYIRITDITNLGDLTDDDWKTAEKIDKQYLLQDNDFLFARSGNTVGKTFLYDSKNHEEAIFAGYFIKFNLDFSNLDKTFFLYYTKSFIYDFWVKGIVRIKGQPNINASEYLELQIPNIPLSQQQRIVNEIKSKLDNQKTIEKEIEDERRKIDKNIEAVIK